MRRSKKTRFALYYTAAQEVSFESRKLGYKIPPNISPQDITYSILAENQHNLQNMDYALHASEMHWARTGHNTIFIPTIDDIENIIKGKYNITEIHSSLFPFQYFSVILPHHYQPFGLIPRGVLVAVTNTQTMNEEFMAPFIQKANMKPVNYRKGEHKGDFLVHVMYATKGHNGHNINTYDADDIALMLQNDDITKLDHPINKTRVTPGHTVNEGEINNKLNQLLVKIITGMAVYIKAKPDALVNGLPKPTAIKIEGTRNPNANTLHFSGTKTATSPNEHHRSWHIRQLVNERYYKGEHAHLEKGSRMVFVKDTIVNRKINPLHIDNSAD